MLIDIIDFVNKSLLGILMLNFVLDVDNMFIYINELITKLLLNLYVKFHVCEYIVLLSGIVEL